MTEKEALLQFFYNIESQEQRKKDIAEDIKESFEAFAKNNGFNLKALKKVYKTYVEYNKNPTEFVEVDIEADALVQTFITEYMDTKKEEPVGDDSDLEEAA